MPQALTFWLQQTAIVRSSRFGILRRLQRQRVHLSTASMGLNDSLQQLLALVMMIPIITVLHPPRAIMSGTEHGQKSPVHIKGIP